MPTRIRQRSPGWDESDDEYMPTWEPSPPRAKRQCTAARKCYAELDSEPEEVEDLSEGDYITEDEFDGGNDSQTNHPQNASMVDEDYDSDVIIVEVKSSPKKKLRGPSPVTTQDATSALVAHYGSGQNAGKIFKSLAVEIHQIIASHLPKDRDVAAYAQICKATSQSVTISVWRQRFIRTFDKPGYADTHLLAKDYLILRGISRKWSCFDEFKLRGSVSYQLMEEQRVHRPLCLNMLKTLIINSNAYKALDANGDKCVIGLNHDYIRKLVSQDAKQNAKDEVQFIDIMDAILDTDFTIFPERIISVEDEYLVKVIQLCLTSLDLQPDYSSKLNHFDLSQKMVYANPVKQPVFTGEWKCLLNIQWLLSAVQFFKFHLKNGGGEGVLADDFSGLGAAQLPQAWLGKLKDDTQPLGTHWKGAYTFMNQRDLINFRLGKSSRYSPGIFVDDFEPFQDISIFFNESKFPSNAWPKSFEDLQKTYPYIDSGSPTRFLRKRGASSPEIIRRKYPIKSFYGTSRSMRPAHFYGRIHALPPQGGIPGFQRVSFVKFYHQDGEVDPSQVWGYEGCVLPGNRIIVGRWWWISDEEVLDDQIFSGPFIFWNVDESSAEPPIKERESLDFLETLRNFGIGL